MIQFLKEKLLTVNPEIQVFENCLESIPDLNPEKWLGLGTKQPIRVFFGAINRQDSWKEWIEPLNQVFESSPDQWEIEVVHDQDFFDALSIQNKKFNPTCDYPTYLSKLESCHIALLPLANTQFNSLKSDLKFVEAAGCEVATLASPTVYAETIQNGITGMICYNAQDIKTILKQWQEKSSEIQKIATSSHHWCMINRLQKQQSERRLQWYWSLWQRKEELTKSLLQRVPELIA